MDSHAIIAEARSWIGTPYRHQGRRKGVGCDCLGLVLGVWSAFKGAFPDKVPPYAADWAEADAQDPLKQAADRYLAPVGECAIQAGHVLLFRWRPHVAAKHLAIATSATHMIHAHDGCCVTEVAISDTWKKKLAFCYKFDENCN